MLITRIRLVLDARMLKSSGIGVYLQSLIPFLLADSGIELTLLGSPAELAAYDCALIPCRSDIYSVAEQFELVRAVPRCDVFWSPHYNVPLLPLRARRRLVTIHDAFHLAFYETLKPAEKIYARTVLPLATRLSNAIVTVSDFSKAEIVRLARADATKITVIHNGVDIGRFAAPVAGTSPVSGPYVLFVGNVKPHKNIAGLIEAFGLLRDRPALRLVIVGQRDNFITGLSGLDEQLKRLGLAERVVFTGFVNDAELVALYQGAALLCFPSFYEGFGLPPIEAMAAGVPVVASRAASIPEVCGAAAAYVDPHEPADIARGIAAVLDEPATAARLVAAGRVHCREFSWERSARAHLKLIQELAST